MGNWSDIVLCALCYFVENADRSAMSDKKTVALRDRQTNFEASQILKGDDITSHSGPHDTQAPKTTLLSHSRSPLSLSIFNGNSC